MNNNNLESLIDFLMELDCRSGESKTLPIYGETFKLSFNGFNIEVPFNALNYVPLLNCLCALSFNQNKVFSIEANEKMFDILALEQLCFNLDECIKFDFTPFEEKNKLINELSEAITKRKNLYLELKKILNLKEGQLLYITKKLKEII